METAAGAVMLVSAEALSVSSCLPEELSCTRQSETQGGSGREREDPGRHTAREAGFRQQKRTHRKQRARRHNELVVNQQIVLCNEHAISFVAKGKY